MEVIIHNFLTAFPTFALVLVIIAMLYILSKGANILVDEAVSISLHWGVPKMIIGATIVSLGTTLPEAAVSVFSAVKGNPDLALGNAIGSIITDTALIIGLASFMGYLPIDKIVVNRQGKIQLFAGILLAVTALPFLPGGVGRISQWIGWIFLVLLVIYIYISIKWTKNAVQDKFASQAELEFAITSDELDEDKSPVLIQMLKLFGGIFLVISSSQILIPAVEISAIRVGIPQSIIAATLIAFGTSLPELVTAVTAVRKGHGELAIGNIVGADILNVLFVVGSAAAVTSGGLEVTPNFYKIQIPAMLIILIIFRVFTSGKNEVISRKQGSILLLMYLIYLVLNFTWI